jgi:hypothetical protein
MTLKDVQFELDLLFGGAKPEITNISLTSDATVVFGSYMTDARFAGNAQNNFQDFIVTTTIDTSYSLALKDVIKGALGSSVSSSSSDDIRFQHGKITLGYSTHETYYENHEFVAGFSMFSEV